MGSTGEFTDLLSAAASVALDFYEYDGTECMTAVGQGGIPGGGPVRNMLNDPTDTAWGYVEEKRGKGGEEGGEEDERTEMRREQGRVGKGKEGGERE